MTSVTPNPQSRGQRPKAQSSRSNNRSAMSQNALTDSPSPMPNKKNRRQQGNTMQSEERSSKKNDPVSPLTPPRSTRPTDIPSLDGNVSPVPTTKKPKRGRKKTMQSSDSAVDPSMVGKNRAPRAAHDSPLATPMKQTQMYAGPTFHASPAPSSLPIPKFFSKSLPSLNKATDMDAVDTCVTDMSTTATEDASGESSSSMAGDSPTLQPRKEHQVREPSPLDVFFNADRKEKAKRTKSELDISSLNENRNLSNFSTLNTPESHSKLAIAGSIFPDIEANGRPKLDDAKRTESSPPVMMTESSNREARAKAKTQALKDLLLNPTRQRPTSISSTSGSFPVPTSANSAFMTPPSNDGRQASGSTTPANLYNNTPSLSRVESPVYNSPYSGIPLARSTQRPLSSHLRQEVVNYASVELPDTPTTPTPSKSSYAQRSSHFTNGGPGHSHRLNSPRPSKFQAEDALKATLSNGNTSVNLMEDELRKILKLDSLGTSIVRS